MNAENIAFLTETINKIGLQKSISRKLVQHICFSPPKFVLTDRVLIERDWLSCSLMFEKKEEKYVCAYYDASLLKGIDLPKMLVQSIDLQRLDLQMSEVDWQLNGSGDKAFILEDETTWQNEQKIEQIMLALGELSSSEEGKHYADSLKLKHWSGSSSHYLIGSLTSLRSKFEVSQRFYLMDGIVISVNEAYRFLINQWMERQQQLKRKQQVSSNENESYSNNDSLLPKKRKYKTGKLKK